MPQPTHISALGVPDPATLPDDLQAIWAKCQEKIGFVPNVFSTLSLKPQRLRDFMQMFNEIMLSESRLSKLEREMVAVVVSSVPGLPRFRRPQTLRRPPTRRNAGDELPRRPARTPRPRHARFRLETHRHSRRNHRNRP